MFREGYYLEVIKAKYSAATAVITVKEKTVELKSKKISTNKWLTLEDWASLYEILEKALVQNSQKTSRSSEKRKFTRHLEIAYTFEASENPSDRTSLPTIRVSVSSVKKRPRHKSASSKKSKNDDNRESKKSEDRSNSNSNSNSQLFSAEIPALDSQTDNIKIEEYIPDTPNTNLIYDKCDIERKVIGYVPSRKSTLEYLQQSANSNEYVPSVMRDETVIDNGAMEAVYVPNSIPKTESYCETYEPSSLVVPIGGGADEYIPNSKGVKKKVDEYQPDFIVRNKSMKFDNSYVPSSSQRIKELKKNDRKIGGSAKKIKTRDTEGRSNKETHLNKKNTTLVQSEIKREM